MNIRGRARPEAAFRKALIRCAALGDAGERARLARLMRQAWLPSQATPFRWARRPPRR